MMRFLLVCLGGACGSGARYLVSLGAFAVFGPRFPIGTLLVNVIGSFAIGVLMQLLPPSELRLFLTAGVLGGFTTYSSFNYETLQLPPWMAIVNVVATFTICLLAGALGLWVARR
ncbi:MAG TPA: CrcB family protein [Thermoanaerobaculia bacterium]|nr:CrcB family protein [Thermoanaerobaculia bacterium]